MSPPPQRSGGNRGHAALRAPSAPHQRSRGLARWPNRGPASPAAPFVYHQGKHIDDYRTLVNRTSIFDLPGAHRIVTRRADQADEPPPPGRRSPEIAPERCPFVKRDDDRIVGAQRLHEAVVTRQV